MKTKPFSLYIHIPFCVHKCPYCDFNTYAVTSIPEKDYTAALLCELDFRAAEIDWRGRSVQTIYFGGGTPSLFSASAIGKVISHVARSFPVSHNIEISLEANPGTVTSESLSSFRAAGVNRLSIGAQSFSPELLQALGRQHGPEQIEAAVNSAQSAGFKNFNLDLIYGIPGQTVAGLRHDLAYALKLEPTHISAYGLTIEKGTPFFVSYKKGLLKLPKEDHVIAMMEELNGFLEICGLHRYEISNFARTGYEARHNMAYWNGDDYLGLGAGAHSFVRSSGAGEPSKRWSNFAFPAKYIKECLSHGQSVGWHEALNRADEVFEFFFLGLRKTDGVSSSQFRAKFGATISEIYPERVKMLTEQGLLEWRGEYLALTSKGLLLSDSVIEEFTTAERPLPESFVPAALQDEQERMAV